MEEVPEGKNYSFPQEEEKILALWESLDAFHTQLKRSEGKPEYIFYDGPPFATGLPHYGHILAGTIKDIVTRYKSARGFHVTRRFGWDCQHAIDKKLGIKYKSRSIVMTYSSEWEKIITRVGRWIDFKNDYKTLDLPFMESVWWVFKQLHEKGLVYRGFKVMPYSTGCITPLSNFEAGLKYKDVSDPAIMIAFPLLEDQDNASLVAWTTTPWTLLSNLALCINAKFTYVRVRSKVTGEVLIVAESRLSQLPSKKAKVATANGNVEMSAKTTDGSKKGQLQEPAKPDSSTYEVICTYRGKDLVGKKYKPMFEYFSHLSDVAFKVVADDYVTDGSGTGVVHCAPAFGEDDYRVCLLAGVIQKGEEFPNPVDSNGCFTEDITAFKGRYVKEADKDIIAAVKALGRLVHAGNEMHKYPYCWRSDTPLIYRAVPSWFVVVESIKERMVENNKKTYWVPDFVKEKRFHNWLENARDWSVSRSRFWGTPLPIWLSDDGQEMVVVGSVQELEELSGFKATDLHRHKIDHVTIPSRRGPEFGVLKRVEDVFDCWFESGSMPYAYIRHPFENQELFECNFPGHFVAEGLDQTRGWFYTLMVLSTALFDKPAFQNLICNGLVLAEDGKKMSKSENNYPPPMDVVNEFGADALRLYLINLPVVRAEPLRFKKDGVFAVVKDVFFPWYNAYRFLVQNALRLGTFQPLDLPTLQKSANALDIWINSACQRLVGFVREEMEAFRLYTVVPQLLKFIESLTNVYVRFNRKRLKGRTGEADSRVALSTLYHVFLTTSKAILPFTPFFSEVLYQNLCRPLGPSAEESVHFCSSPEVQGKSDHQIEESVGRMMRVIELARTIREQHNKPLKTPLREMVIVHHDSDFLEDITGKLGEYVSEEVNVRTIKSCNDPLTYASLRAEPDFSVLGKRLGKAMGLVAKEVNSMTQSDILTFEKSGEATFAGHKLTGGDIKVIRDFRPPDGFRKEDIDAAGDGDVLVMLDLQPDESLIEAGFAREIVNRVQKLRKKAGLEPTDIIEVHYEVLEVDPPTSENNCLSHGIETQAAYIKDSLGSPLLPLTSLPGHAVVIDSEVFKGVGGGTLEVTLSRTTLSFVKDALAQLCSGQAQHAENVQVYLLSRDLANLKTELAANQNKMKVDKEGQQA